MSNKYEGGENMKNLQKQNKVCVPFYMFKLSHSMFIYYVYECLKF